jgi:hypothetical protein
MYTLYPDYVLRQSDDARIPLDPENADYQAFVEWASDNEPALPTGPTHAELVDQAKAATRIQRQPIISVLDGLQSSAIVKGETARALAIETAKQGLRDITDTDLSACVTYEDMRLKVKARYIELATALPADIRKAFSEAIN